MPKAGRYDYPTRDLDHCISALQKAHDTAKQYVMTRDVFGQAIGMSPKGGGFNVLVGSMAMYKLIETGEGEIRFTDLAKNILHGEADEKADAKAKAVRNVILLGDIYDTYGSNPTDEQLRVFLRTKANVDISEASQLASEVGKLFKKVANYLRPVTNATMETGSGGEKKELKEESFESNTITEEYKLGGGIEIKLPKENTTQAWNKAKRALDIILDVENNSDQN